MNRREALKQIGTASVLTLGATGIGSARSTEQFLPAKAEYLVTEVDGEARQFTPEEFERHPATPSLADVTLTSDCCYECCECCDACCADEVCCCGGDCGSCSSC